MICPSDLEMEMLIMSQYGPFAGVGLFVILLLWWRFF